MSNAVWVQMTISISGGRADGRNWPERWGDAIDLPADEAWPLIRAGNAVEVQAPKRAAAPLPPPTSLTPAPQSEPATTARGPVVESSWDLTGPPAGGVIADSAPDEPVAPHVSVVRENAAAENVAELEPPKPADPKQAWVDHAMAHGETEDEANMQTKAGLMSKYGGRL